MTDMERAEIYQALKADMQKMKEEIIAEFHSCVAKVEELCNSVKAGVAVDYDRISAIMENKMLVVGAAGTETKEEILDVVLDDQGIKAIAKKVAEELSSVFEVCAVEERIAEDIAEVPAEEPAAEESAMSTALGFEEIGDGKYLEAETGLVIRLKKSFTAKMKQSDEKVKKYYSALKNELTAYKKINSNVSWHGDRFNFGRDTVAKITICGKTLGLYLALDPNDEEFKSTVYHQKDVGNQKAYEHTPFMVKIKSDAAVKKAARLIAALAAKLETERDENHVSVDYVSEYDYETTQQLYAAGYIKATKEKKVELDF